MLERRSFYRETFVSRGQLVGIKKFIKGVRDGVNGRQYYLVLAENNRRHWIYFNAYTYMWVPANEGLHPALNPWRRYDHGA